jgi:superfamily II DNA or RNA helicase
MSHYNKIIVESKKYFELITKLTTDLITREHTIIIIAFTRLQVELINKTLTENNIDNRMYYGSKNDIDKENDRVVVCTYNKTGKGFNMPKLSAIILALPLVGKKSLIQTTGRILRSVKNKKTPEIYDLVDISIGNIMTSNIPIKTNIFKQEFKGCNFETINYNE